MAFLGETGGILEVFPFFRCVFTNHGQGLSTSLTLFHPLGMSFKKKEQLQVRDFCPLASFLQNNSNQRIVL
jgi:hypothetical protein